MKYLIAYILVLLVISCVSPNTALEESKSLKMKCFQINDTTLYVKLTNTFNTDIYIPKFVATYSVNSDTIYLEAFSNPEFNTTYYYRYDSVLPFPIYTVKKIGDVAVDSTIINRYEVAYNQFGVEDFTVLKKDSTSLLKVNFIIPVWASNVTARYFTVPFSKVLKFGYSVPEFVSFNKEYGKPVSSLLYKVYK